MKLRELFEEASRVEALAKVLVKIDKEIGHQYLNYDIEVDHAYILFLLPYAKAERSPKKGTIITTLRKTDFFEGFETDLESPEIISIYANFHESLSEEEEKELVDLLNELFEMTNSNVSVTGTSL